MTRITNAEQVLLLLRGHLQRAQGARKKDAPSKRGQVRRGPLDRVQQMAATENLSDAEIARALIAGLLTEEFGGDVANDPQFQSMIDDVHAILQRDDSSRALLAKALVQLSASTG